MKIKTVRSINGVYKSKPFDIEEIEFQEDEPKKVFSRLVCPDWVTILPATVTHETLLIRQYRVGILKPSLELPGGMIDSHEKDPTMAAIRELEEETGLTTKKILPLGTFDANPAINSNKIHYFIALECEPANPRKHFADPDESFSYQLVANAELENLARTGRVNHAYSSMCIMLGLKYLKINS